MKHTGIFVITLLLLLAPLLNVHAKDSSQWSLPENAIARIGKGRITDMAYSPDGKLLAVGTSIGVWLYDANSGAELALLKGYTNDDFERFSGNRPHASTLSFSPDGRMLASAYWDGNVRVWDVPTRKLITTIKGYWRSTLFSPDGNILATDDIWWDAHIFEQKSPLTRRSSGKLALAFSTDGTTLLTEGRENAIILWDLRTRKNKTVQVSDTSFLKSIDYSPDGTTIVCRGSKSNTVGLWDPVTGEQKAELTGHTGVVNSVAYSPDGKTIASTCWEMIRLWDANTGHHIFTIPRTGAPFIKILYAPDGTSLTSVSADGKIQLWDKTTGQLKSTLIQAQNIFSMLLSPNGKTFATGVYGDIMLWDVDMQQPMTFLIGDTDIATPALFSQDGTTLTSISSNMDRTRLLLWDLQTGKHRETFSKQLKDVYLRTLSPDGETLALKMEDSTIQLWNTTIGEQKATLTKQQGRFDSMIFSPDSSLFVTRDNKGTIELWDAKTGQHKTVLTNQGEITDALAFSPDGKILACGGNNQTHLWHMKTESQISTFRTTGRMPGFYSLAFSADGTLLASGSYDGKIRLWNTKTGLLMDTFIGHTGPIESLVFLPPPKHLVAANAKINAISQTATTLASLSRDGTVLFWEVKPFVDTKAVVNIKPSLIESPDIGEQLTLNVDIVGGESVNGYQLTVEFDATALRYVSSKNGNYLPSSVTFEASVGPLWMHSPNRLSIVGACPPSESNDGDGTLASITFEVIKTKASTLSLPKVHLEKRNGNLARPIVVHGTVLDSSTTKDVPRDYTQFSLPEGAIARLGKGTINDIKFSPDNTKLFVASSIGIWVYDANTGDELALLTEHMGSVESIVFSPKGELFACVRFDGTLHLLDSHTYKKIKTIKTKSGVVAFSPDGRTLASGKQFWDFHTGQQKADLKWRNSNRVAAVTFSPDGAMLATANSQNKVQLWDVSSGMEKKVLYEGISYNSRGQRLTFSPDGTMLAASFLDHNGRNNTISLWNIHTRELLQTYSEKDGSLVCLSIDFSAEGELITVVTEWYGTLHIRNFHTDEKLAVLEGHTEQVRAVVYSADKTTLASAGQGGSIHLWDIETGKPRTTITGHTLAITSMAMSAQTKTLVTAHRDQPVQLWDLFTLRHKGTIQDDKGHLFASAVAFSPDSVTLAGGGWEHVWLRDTKTQERKLTITIEDRHNIKTIAFSPNGRTLIVDSRYNHTIPLWDAHTGEHKLTLNGHAEQINALAFSPDGTTIASADILSDKGESVIRLWDAKTGALRTTIANLVNPNRNQRLPVIAVAFSPDGKTLASVDASSDIQLWDADTGKHKTTLTTYSMDAHGNYAGNYALAFSPDGTTLATSDYSIDVWDVETGKHQKALKGHSGRVTSLEYSEDGTTLVSGSTDGTVLLWEMKSKPDTRLNITPISVQALPIGKRLSFNINMTDGQDVTGYQFTLEYDATALRFIPDTENTTIRNIETSPPVVTENAITLAGNAAQVSSIKDGTIATVTFEVIKRTDVTLTITEAHLTHDNGKRSRPVVGHAWVFEPPRIPEDANRDWQLDAADLEFVSSRLGQKGKENSADINGDGIVDIADLVLVRNALYGPSPESDTK